MSLVGTSNVTSSRDDLRSSASHSKPADALGAVIVLAQLLVLDLCATRTAADLLTRSMSVEGGIALALALILAVTLARRLFRARRRFAKHPNGNV